MFAMRPQQGLTLIELMIGLLVGSIITAGAISVFNNTLKSNSDNLNLARINQDLRGMMDIMVRDIRRAGYVTDQPGFNDNLPAGNVDGINDDLTNNPFFDSETVITPQTTDITVLDDGSCILYAYNRDNDSPATVAGNERLGFKLQDNQLKMRKNGATNDDCSNGLEWENITEPEVEITQLDFNLTEDAYDVTSMITDVVPAGGDGFWDGDDNHNGTCDTGEACRTCTLDGSPDPACIFTRSVDISLTGRLAADHAVFQTITEHIKIRNDKYVAAVP